MTCDLELAVQPAPALLGRVEALAQVGRVRGALARRTQLVLALGHASLELGALVRRRCQAQLQLAQFALEPRDGALGLADAPQAGLLVELGPPGAALGQHRRVDHRPGGGVGPVLPGARRRREPHRQRAEVELDGLLQLRGQRLRNRERGAEGPRLGRGADGGPGRPLERGEAMLALLRPEHEHGRAQVIGRLVLPRARNAQQHRAQIRGQDLDRIDAQPHGLGGARAGIDHGRSG